MEKTEIQVERTWDLVRDSGQRKLTSSFQNHCTLHSVPVGAKPLSPRQCAPSRSIYLSRRLNSHWEILVTTHHLQKWESQLRLRWPFSFTHNLILYKLHICKADIRNPLSLLAHERSRFATCQWELLTPTDISIPPYPPLSAPRTWSWGMLILRSNQSNIHKQLPLPAHNAIAATKLGQKYFFAIRLIFLLE